MSTFSRCPMNECIATCVLLIVCILCLRAIPSKRLKATSPSFWKVLYEAQTEQQMLSSTNHRRVKSMWIWLSIAFRTELVTAHLPLINGKLQWSIPLTHLHMPSCLFTSLALRQGICHTHDRNLMEFLCERYKEWGTLGHFVSEYP